jgi:starch-binding outer membrane protein, SusD/RagB family
MNKLKKIIALTALAVIGATSCTDSFLHEELKTNRNYDYFATAEGVQDLATALYSYYRWPFNVEQHPTTSIYGTDEFTVGGDNSNHDWNDYTANLSPLVITINSNTTSMAAIWDNMYKPISIANLVIANAENAFQSPAAGSVYMAEASFARAWSYFKLVQHYGGVVLKLEPSESVERYFVRSSRQDCVNQVIADFRVALEGLPATETVRGKLYKDVARHYLAKALLYRVSEINDDWNGPHKTADLAEIITLTNQVIANRALAVNFRDLFAFTEPDGANEKLSEVLFAAQFSDAATAVQGNRMHLYFISQYNNLTGLYT